MPSPLYKMHHRIDLKQTGFLHKAVHDYLFDADKLSAFFAYKPTIASIEQVIAQRRNITTDRATLTDVLRNQYSNIEVTDAVVSNIDKLLSENTFTITTAHQPNLLLGPLYVIHKIASVIKLAQQLSTAYTNYHFVPVYWMGSEDHDKQELANINLFGKQIIWNTNQSGAFGRFHLNDIEEVRNQVHDILGNSDAAAALKQFLDLHYFSKPNIAEATRSLVNVLFGQYGLLIIDGDDVQLKQAFVPLMQEELIQQTSYKEVSAISEALIHLGYKPQAAVREINLFYLTPNSRERIIKTQEHYNIGNRTFNEAQLLKELHHNPSNFSPNVIIRPLYQALILPDLIFTGGAAEIAYHLQLKKLFEAYKLHYPMLVLRDIAIYVQSSFLKKLEKFNLQITDLFKPSEILVKQYLQSVADVIIDLQQERKQMLAVHQTLKAKVAGVDKSLIAFVEAEYKKWEHSMDALEEKLKRSEKRKAEDSIQQLYRLRNQLLPDNNLHERKENFLQYYLKYGDRYIAQLIQSFDAFDTQIKVIQLD